MKTLGMLFGFPIVTVLCFGVSTFAKDSSPKDFDNKYFVVMRSGLALGTCDIPCSGSDNWCNGKLLPTLAVRVDGSDVEFHPQSGFGVCDQSSNLLPNTIGPGTVLLSSKSWIDKREKRYCLLLQTVFPISVNRGIGAFAHPSAEFEAMSVRIHLSDPTNIGLIGPALSQWLAQTDSLASALKLSAGINYSEARAAVKQIQLGMTFEDVEKIMGQPDTRVELGPKVLYKYPTMTVVFENGRVADVQ